MSKMRDVAKQTRDVYERNATFFDEKRPKIFFEKGWVERFQALLFDNAKILDVGCGAGQPIAQYFIEQGFDVTGVDFSQNMLDIVQSRFPDHDWRLMDMRELSFDTKFNGIIAWHSFFHLTPDEQRSTLKKMADHLEEKGALMVTVGHEAGEVLGHVGHDEVYHSSLSYEEYEALLQSFNMKITRFSPLDDECDGSTILLAQKK